LGRLAGDEAMRALGIDSEEDLFLLMAQAHLPMPRLPEADTREHGRSTEIAGRLSRLAMAAKLAFCCPTPGR
jgi:hypothetical protein